MSRQIGGIDRAEAFERLSPPLSPPPAITPDEYAGRLERLRGAMADHDAVLIAAGPSLRYFSGIAVGPSERLIALLVTRNGAVRLIAPAFEQATLDAECAIALRHHGWHDHEDPVGLVAACLREEGLQRVAVDPWLPAGMFMALDECLDRVTLTSAQAAIDACRQIKSPAEMALIGHAMQLTLAAQRAAATILYAGITNVEVAAFIDAAHRSLGADDGSTFCIVQFDRGTAYPHGLPGVRRLGSDELVLIDTGCTYQGYHADITRTYIFGRPNAEQQRIWWLEHAAQQAAFAAARPGATCGAVDDAARTTLAEAGLGPDYQLPGLPHRTGHGLGLAIHEPPYLVRGSDVPLAEGMCCSNEPMIVVPDRFGVRLEDHFHVTAEGAACFTPPAIAIDRPFDDGHGAI